MWPSSWSFSSWLSGTAPDFEDDDFQTPGAGSGNRRPSTRSPTTHEAKRRKISLETYSVEERLKHFEEIEQVSEARAERIESLLNKVLKNQEKILSEDRVNEVDDKDNEEDEESDKELITTFKSPSPIKQVKAPSSTTARKWTTKERNIVMMAHALYGRDYKSICDHLEGRNRNQLSGFFRRNERLLQRKRNEYPHETEKEKADLLAMIERRVERPDENDDAEDESNRAINESESESDSENGNESMNGGANVGENSGFNMGVWSDEERAMLLKGIEIHGREKFALSAFMKTRSPGQVKGYLFRRVPVNEE